MPRGRRGERDARPAIEPAPAVTPSPGGPQFLRPPRRRTAPSLPRPRRGNRGARPRLAGDARATSRRPRRSRITRGPTRSSSSISPGLSVMGLRDLPNLAPIRARLARATVVAKKAGANAPASVLRRCVGSPYSSSSSPQPVRGLRFFQGEWCRPSVPTIRRTPPKGRGCEASPFAPSQSQIAGSVGGGRLGRRGHVDVDCRFLLGRSAPAFYGCCRRGQKKARTEKRGNRAGLDLRAAGRSVRLGDATAPIRQRSMRKEVT